MNYPWQDYGGKVSPLKTIVFIGLFLPGLWVAFALATDRLGARPLNEAIHQIGLWTIRFIFLSLTVTPLRRLLSLPRLLLVRRMIGVAAAVYVCIHLSLYAADQSFNLVTVAKEIVLRIYLTIGFVALLGLVALAVTSTDGMMRRMGARRWQRLHQLIYLIGILAVIHYFMQSKLNETEPTVMAGLLGWLLGWRLLAKTVSGDRLSVTRALGLSLLAGIGTALGEAGYFWLVMGVDPIRVLGADLSLDTGVRPAWYVLGICCALTLAAALRQGLKRYRRQRLRPA